MIEPTNVRLDVQTLAMLRRGVVLSRITFDLRAAIRVVIDVASRYERVSHFSNVGGCSAGLAECDL